MVMKIFKNNNTLSLMTTLSIQAAVGIPKMAL